jgi:hypothetical protein
MPRRLYPARHLEAWKNLSSEQGDGPMNRRSFCRWCKRVFRSPAGAGSDRGLSRRVRPALEPLEDRVVMTGPTFAPMSVPWGSDQVHCSVVDPAGQSVFFGMDSGAVWRLNEATGSWTSWQTPALVTSLALAGPGDLAVGVGSGIGNTSVYQINESTSQVTQAALSDGMVMEWKVLGTSAGVLAFDTYHGNVFLSTDQGLTYHEVASPGAQAVYSCFVAKDGSVYMGGEGISSINGAAPLVSHDGGSTWQAAGVDLSNSFGNLVGLGQANNGNILVGRESLQGAPVLRISSLGVVSVSSTGLPLFTFAQDFAAVGNNTVLVALAKSSVTEPPMVSADDGQTWQAITSLPATADRGGFAQTAGYVYYYDAAGLYRAALSSGSPTVSGTNSTVRFANPTVSSGNTDTATLVVEDTAGNPVSGLSNSAFTLALSGGSSAGTFGPVSATATPGTYTATFTATTAGTVSTLTTTVNGVVLNSQPTVTVAAAVIVPPSPPPPAVVPTSIAIIGVQSQFSLFGQTETISARVSGANGQPVPGGTVSFTDNGQRVNAAVDNGVATATLTFSLLNEATSPHPVTALFGGSGMDAASSTAATAPSAGADFFWQLLIWEILLLGL